MKVNLTKHKAIKLIEEKIIGFEEIMENATYENRYDSKYKEIYYGSEIMIEQLFGEKEKNNFRLNVSGYGASNDGEVNYTYELKHYKDHVSSCISQLKVFKESIIDFWHDENENIAVESKDKMLSVNEIFIIHGHNDEMKQSVARLIEKFGLKPIILHERPNKGKTIIEKFEHNASVNFAIALLSADDIILNGNEKKFRPRQNVIFEMGYFIGRLGRDKVIALCEDEKNIEILSDYYGVLYIPFDKKESWKVNLCKELREAGYSIDMNKI